MRDLQRTHILGGTLLVSGTSIGAGMLALPVVTSLGGFFPSLVIYGLCWLFMTGTGLLFLEACLRLPKGANIISMASFFLGKPGKVGAWILYLFLFYSLSVAYISGGADLLHSAFNLTLPVWLCGVIFTVILGGVVYFGALYVDRLNLILILGLVISYLFFIVYGWDHVQPSFLFRKDWKLSLFALPVVFTSFGYQGVIPTLTEYMHRKARDIRIAILLGTTLTFLVYVIWQYLILGILPVEGVYGLQAAKNAGLSSIQPLKHYLQNSLVYTLGQFFAFFAITTSFLGVNLGLFDFMADGLCLPKKGRKKLFLAVVTFLPPLLVAILFPGLFLIALSYAGGVGCALLLGLLPTLMIWVDRYIRKEEPLGKRQLFGGKALLVLFFAFVVFELIIEFSQEWSRLLS